MQSSHRHCTVSQLPQGVTLIYILPTTSTHNISHFGALKAIVTSSLHRQSATTRSPAVHKESRCTQGVPLYTRSPAVHKESRCTQGVPAVYNVTTRTFAGGQKLQPIKRYVDQTNSVDVYPIHASFRLLSDKGALYICVKFSRVYSCVLHRGYNGL